jgi:hypothetical protein
MARQQRGNLTPDWTVFNAAKQNSRTRADATSRWEREPREAPESLPGANNIPATA